MEVLPELVIRDNVASEASSLPEFEALIAALLESQREVLTLLKVNELSLEKVARITSSTVGAMKQKAHRAYERLREILSKPTINKCAIPIIAPTTRFLTKTRPVVLTQSATSHSWTLFLA
jgi:hypothetical protein